MKCPGYRKSMPYTEHQRCVEEKMLSRLSGELDNAKGHARLRSLVRETSPSVALSMCRTVTVASATGKFVMSWRFERQIMSIP